jgi:hypothetical protein
VLSGDSGDGQPGPLGSLVADELFIAYEVQQAHRTLFDLELITLLALGYCQMSELKTRGQGRLAIKVAQLLLQTL